MVDIVHRSGREQSRDDRSLAQEAAAGDELAQQQLMSRLLEGVRATVGYLAAGDPDADDLVQLSLIQILESAGSYRGEARLETWATRITVRTSLRQLKRRRGRKETGLDLEQHAAALATGPPSRFPAGGGPALSAEEAALRSELHQYLAAILGKLNPERRVAMVLRWVHGYSIREISDMTDTREVTVHWRLRKGRKELRRCIRRDEVLHRWEELFER